jgi:Fe-S cluster assembly protein SufB
MSHEHEQLERTDLGTNFDFKNDVLAVFKSKTGLTEKTVRHISGQKEEPEWMLERRLSALEQFKQMPMPTDWPGQPDLSEIDIDEIVPYLRPDLETQDSGDSWDDLPEDIPDTFDRLEIPEAEKETLSGAGAQYESEASTRT